MDIIFATNNQHKAKEVNDMLPEGFNVLSLKDVKLNEEVEENGDTLEANSKLKADYVSSNTSTACFADDTGLFVESLDGRPGIYAARYAGENCDSKDNIIKLLGELEGKENRKAYFKTVLCLHINGKELFFEGIRRGTISSEYKGNEGFGYNPVFVPEGYDKSFSELPMDLRKKINHRAIAVSKLNEYLKTI